MAAQWLDLGGGTGWYYYPQRPLSGWVTNRRDDQANVYHRYGDPVQLRKLAGKVVRGYSLFAHQDTPPRNNVTIAAWPYLVTPQPQLVWTLSDWVDGQNANRSSVYEDTGIPIGRFPDLPGNSEVASNDWLGAYTADAVQNRADTTPPNPTPGPPPEPGSRFYFTRFRFTPDPPRSFKVLIDDPPSWEIVAPEAVSRTDVVPLNIRLFWPDGSPVPALRVRVTVGAFTSVRALNSGGGFSFSTAATDAGLDGVARFELRGDHVGVESLQISFDSVDAWRANFFEPAFGGTKIVAVNGIAGDDPDTGCYVVPAVPAIPSVPAREEILPWFEWNAGANSVAAHDGDVRTVFTMLPAIGVVVGFVTDRDDPTNITRVTHGFSFTTSANNVPRAQVIESGAGKGAFHHYNDETEFQIRRIAGTVTYWVDDEMVYVSRIPSAGEVMVGTSLYASGDTAPGPSGGGGGGGGDLPEPLPEPSGDNEVDLVDAPGFSLDNLDFSDRYNIGSRLFNPAVDTLYVDSGTKQLVFGVTLLPGEYVYVDAFDENALDGLLPTLGAVTEYAVFSVDTPMAGAGEPSSTQLASSSIAIFGSTAAGVEVPKDGTAPSGRWFLGDPTGRFVSSASGYSPKVALSFSARRRVNSGAGPVYIELRTRLVLQLQPAPLAAGFYRWLAPGASNDTDVSLLAGAAGVYRVAISDWPPGEYYAFEVDTQAGWFGSDTNSDAFVDVTLQAGETATVFIYTEYRTDPLRISFVKHP